jgi:hypothetical protein
MPDCGAQNLRGKGGRHIELEEDGLATCRICRRDWRPDLRADNA